MSGRRYVVLGLASGSPTWMAEATRRLATAGVAGELLVCAGVADLGNRLASGRPFSALLVDHRTVGLDRELIDRASAAGCPVVVVGRTGDRARWQGLGAVDVLDDSLDPDDLAQPLRRHGPPIGSARSFNDDDHLPLPRTPVDVAPWQGRIVAVTGPGGTGASSVARALTDGLGRDVRFRESVVLVDACLEADQARLHGLTADHRDLQSAVQAHRGGDPDGDGLTSLLVADADWPYRLLPGIRRRRDWPAIGGASLRATLANLARHHLVTVVDVDPFIDLAPPDQPVGPATPGEPARVVMGLADLVIVVGRPGTKGTMAASRVVANLADDGLADERCLTLMLHPTVRPRRRLWRRPDPPNTLPIDGIADPGTAPLPSESRLLARQIVAHLDPLPRRNPAATPPLPPGSLGTEGGLRR